MSVKRDGKTIDTLENFRWPFLIGGPADGQRVPTAKSWDQKTIEVDEETYLRHRSLTVGAPARIGFFIAEDWPKDRYETYELHRRILNAHPDLEKMDDIAIETKNTSETRGAPDAEGT